MHACNVLPMYKRFDAFVQDRLSPLVAVEEKLANEIFFVHGPNKV